MSTFLGSVWWMIVSLGVLVTFHEFGHYWVARRCGVRACGSRSASASRCGCDAAATAPNTRSPRSRWAATCGMLDEREGEVAAVEAPQAFNRQPVFRRIAIVAAGRWRTCCCASPCSGACS